jgi:PAS domain S-box-containing protein
MFGDACSGSPPRQHGHHLRHTPTLEVSLLKGRPLLDYRREGGSYLGVDRRCRGQAGQSPSEALMQIPVLTVLERIPEPVLGIGRDGKVVFANTAFCDMLGYTQETLLTLDIQQISNLDGQRAFTRMRAPADEPVQLVHSDGFIVAAAMSMSALRRHDDALVIVTFKDLTEQLWSTAAVEGQGRRSDKTQASSPRDYRSFSATEDDCSGLGMADRCGQAANSPAVEGRVTV